MKRRLQVWSISLAAAAVALTVGCAPVSTQFVYRPGPPAVDGPKAPARVAVLAFKDGTEDLLRRRQTARGGQRNLAKTGSGSVPALPPELWAKFFADDLAASGSFGSARFLYSASELVDEEFFVEGTVKKAYWGATSSDVNEFTLALVARRTADNNVVWAKEVAREWKIARKPVRPKGTKRVASRFQAEINNALQDMFAEARAGLLAAVGARSGGGDGGGDGRGVPSAGGVNPPESPAPESPERTIERILQGQ